MRKEKKFIYLNENMLDDNNRVIFEADIPYEVVCHEITNENGFTIKVISIWVDYCLEHTVV